MCFFTGRLLFQERYLTMYASKSVITQMIIILMYNTQSCRNCLYVYSYMIPGGDTSNKTV